LFKCLPTGNTNSLGSEYGDFPLSVHYADDSSNTVNSGYRGQLLFNRDGVHVRFDTNDDAYENAVSRAAVKWALTYDPMACVGSQILEKFSPLVDFSAMPQEPNAAAVLALTARMYNDIKASFSLGRDWYPAPDPFRQRFRGSPPTSAGRQKGAIANSRNTFLRVHDS